MKESTRSVKHIKSRIRAPFWDHYIELIQTHVIPYQWEALNDRIPEAPPSYAIHNFMVAAGLKKGEHGGPVYQESDLYKWIEAASYILMTKTDLELEKNIDGIVDIICRAQLDDGYINAYYINTGIEKRWTNLMNNHELYCLGHLIEAACAYFEATGKDKLLNAVIRYVDLVDRTFGPEEAKLHGYPGHEEIELALVKLFDLTKDDKYLRLAKYFIDERGREPLYFQEECIKNGRECGWSSGPHGFHYYQAAIPVRELQSARGHAVRAVYLYSGMADVARNTGDEKLFETCKTLWKSITTKQMYITGSIGSTKHGEAFSFDYDLPNDTIYAETCAAIGLIFFARRMLEIEADSQYSDVMERALYNGVISGVSLDGKSFFYVNPLEVYPEASEKDFFKSHVKVERQKWYGTACCPPNLARLLTSLGTYAYNAKEDSIFIHLYLGGKAVFSIKGIPVELDSQTNYPWDGEVNFIVNPKKEEDFTLALRIPGWCSRYKVSVNGNTVEESRSRGYLGIRRKWKAGDLVSLTFDMPVIINSAHPLIRENTGKVALTRGPLVYCIEEADNGKNLHLLSIGKNPDFQFCFKNDLLEGTGIIQCQGMKTINDWPEGTLYQSERVTVQQEQVLTFIPYYAWANRGSGEMQVWIHRKD